MKRNEVLACIKEVCSPYTAPFNEHAVRAAIHQQLAAHKLPYTVDAYGNTITRIRHGIPRRKIAFIAHLDHPAFRVEKVNGSTVTCVAEGGLPGKGVKGASVVFPSTDAQEKKPGKGKITAFKSRTDATGRVWMEQATIKMAASDQPPEVGAFGVFDFAGFTRQGDKIKLRAADDPAGAAAVLAALIGMSKSSEPLEVWGIFTRAEEVGFQGALALVLDGKLPRDLFIVSVECSKAYDAITLGGGPVIRLGDRSGPFSLSVCALLRGAAESLGKKFKYQEGMMAGGTCEATAFLAFGYTAGGLAIPLGNYHNQTSRGVAPEEIHLGDVEGAIALMHASALRAGAGTDDVDLLRNRLIRDSEEGRERLRAPNHRAGGLAGAKAL